MNKKIFALLFTFFAYFGFSQNVDYVMDPAIQGSNIDTISGCSFTIYDTGGTGAGGPYGNNENFTLTICPNVPGDIISIVWTIFNLDPTDLNPDPNVSDADNITVYNAAFVDPANTLGTYTSGGINVGDVFTANPAQNPANVDGCLTIVFNSNAANTTIPAPDYAFTASCTTPCDPPTADGMMLNASNAAGDSIAGCVGDTIFFQDNGSFAAPSFNLVDWVWHWSDGTPNDTTLAGVVVGHSFTIPGEYIIQLEVIDDNGCSNLNATDIRVYVTTYPTFDPFPNDTTLCVGESVVLSAFPDAYEVTWSGFPLSVQDDDNCMEDNVGAVVQTPMLITGYDPNISLDNANPDVLDICVEIEHSFIGDFVLQVQCPTGQIMTLHQQGGGGVNLGDPDQGSIDCNNPATFGTPWTYCFDANATQTWVDAVAAGNTVPNATGGNSIPAGSYLPVDPAGFAALDGCPINGQWNLLFTDLWGGDDGSIPGWSINFDPSLNPPVTNFTPDIGSGSDSSYWDITDPNITANTPDLNSITVAAVTGGVFEYDYTVTNNFGCSFDSIVTIYVDTNMFISAGPDLTICAGQPDTIGPGAANGGSSCDYMLLLVDTFGDGWNGNSLDVTTNAGTTNYTGPAVDSIWIPLTLSHGEVVTFQYNSTGGWPFENEIHFLAADGTTVYTNGVPPQPTTPTPLPQSVTVDCYLGYVFNWTPNNGTITTATDVNPLVAPLVQTTYTLTSYPIGHPLCATTDDVTVDVGVFLDPGEDSIISLCKEGVAENLFNYLGGTPFTTGSWFDPAGVPITMPIDLSVAIDGDYEYRIDSADCVVSAYISLTVIEVVITSLITDASCHTICDGALDITATNGVLYSIDNGLTFQNSNILSGLCVGNQPVVVKSVVVSNGTECFADSIFVITEPDAIDIIDITDDHTLCLGESTNLTVQRQGGSNGNYSYSWDNGIAINAATAGFTPTGSTTVCVTVSDADCPLSPTADSCMIITVPTDLNISIPLLPNGCYPHDFILQNTTDGTSIDPLFPTSTVVTTTWLFSDGTEYQTNGNSDVSHQIELPGNYDVTVTVVSDYGCTYTKTFTPAIDGGIIVYDRPDPDFILPSNLDIFNTLAQFRDLSIGNDNIDSWVWSFPGGFPSFSDLEDPVIQYPEGIPATYPVTLTVFNEHQCENTIEGTFEITNDVNIYAPNVFTPDDDQYNNTWRVYISGIEIYDFHLTIFNRWGEIVFESYDASAEWNGTYGNSGNVVVEGSYVWTIDTKDIRNDNRYEFSGSITILK